METVKIAGILGSRKIPGTSSVAILLGPTAADIKMARVCRAGCGDDRGQEEVLTIDSASSCEQLLELLPPGCSRVALMHTGDGAAAADACEALSRGLAERNIDVERLDDVRTRQLKGLAHFWFTRAGQLAVECQLWHAQPPPCAQLVTHTPSWQRINDRLARRMLRNGPPGDTIAGETAIVAELGPRDLSLYKIDSTLGVKLLLREPFLGYRNLLGLARLSGMHAAPASAQQPAAAAAAASSRLQDLLNSAARGSLKKLDTTIGDLLPAESAYGHYDLDVIIFTLGKLHDSKSLAELQPSANDVAASLAYVFVKTFFDAVVHATSAHGISRVIVAGDFFQSEWCRQRLMETWNFTGVSKDALKLHFLRQESAELLTLTGGLL